MHTAVFSKHQLKNLKPYGFFFFPTVNCEQSCLGSALKRMERADQHSKPQQPGGDAVI